MPYCHRLFHAFILCPETGRTIYIDNIISSRHRGSKHLTVYGPLGSLIWNCSRPLKVYVPPLPRDSVLWLRNRVL